ncbi:hypothetical protein ACE14D_12620 [Streptomyces sp. Act-28]
MPHSDEELPDFDTGTLEDRRPVALDGECGALRRNHPRMARHLERWAREESRRTDTDPRYRAGCARVLGGVAAFLRRTRHLPGDRG